MRFKTARRGIFVYRKCFMERFSRTKLLVGNSGLEALAKSSVVILGLGGVGSFTAEALARAGLGRLRLVDHDVVDITNINRQLHALESSVGLAKAEVLARRFREINPQAELEPVVEFYSPGQGEVLLAGFDWVVDAVDTVTAKLDIISWCREHSQSVISSMGAGNKLDAAQFRVDDISKTFNCPLARTVRKELRKRGIRKGIPVAWSPELPREPEEHLVQGARRQLPGSISYVPAVAGLLIASYIVNRIIAVK